MSITTKGIELINRIINKLNLKHFVLNLNNCQCPRPIKTAFNSFGD